jgi:predicted TIM-barrel fold metal-dependent hydrolase
VTAADAGGLHDLPLRQFRPEPRLVTDRHDVPRAGVPAIDAHAHLGRWLTGGAWAVPDVAALLELMDAANITTIVNLDGRWGDELHANLDRYDRRHPQRFATFCHVDWTALRGLRPGARLAADLSASIAAGARGLKVWKDLGLHVRDSFGHLVRPDDDRLTPLWEQAATSGVPVAIHTADPIAFFDPVDEYNERLEELLAHPDWSLADPVFPRFHQLMDSLENLVASQPQTTFIGVHVGCYAEDLSWVSRMLDSYDNFFIDLAARIAELGRQARRARTLILRHPDRILFGTDKAPLQWELYQIYFRFMETDDEHFAYSPKEPPPNGRWRINGLHLPPEVATKVYRANALRLIPPPCA